MNRTQPRAFIVLRQFLELAGVELETLLKFGTIFEGPATSARPHIEHFYRALRMVGITFYEIIPRTTNARALEQAVLENPKGVVVLIFEHSPGKGHAIIGQVGAEGKAVFYDPQIAKSYVGLSALLADFPTMQAKFPCIFLPNAVATKGGSSIIGSIMFAILPLSVGGLASIKPMLGAPKGNGTVDRGPI
jgi:hypothetical protein